jgi:hypothetical protein
MTSAAAAGEKRKAAAMIDSEKVHQVHYLMPNIYPTKPEDLHLVVQVTDKTERAPHGWKGGGDKQMMGVVLRDRDNDIQDPKNEIKTTLWSSNNPEFENWVSMMVPGTVIRIKRGQATVPKNTKWNPTTHRYELGLARDATIERVSAAELKRNGWTFGEKRVKYSVASVTCPISREAMAPFAATAEDEGEHGQDFMGPKVTLLGVVVSSIPQSGVSKKTNRDWSMLKTKIADTNLQTAELVQWGEIQPYEVGVVLVRDAHLTSELGIKTGPKTLILPVTESDYKELLEPSAHAMFRELNSWIDPRDGCLTKEQCHFMPVTKWDRNSVSNQRREIAKAETTTISDLQEIALQSKAIIAHAMEDNAADGQDENAEEGRRFVPVPDHVAVMVTSSTYKLRASVNSIVVHPKRALMKPVCANRYASGAAGAGSAEVCGKPVTWNEKAWYCKSCEAELVQCDYHWCCSVEITDATGVLVVLLFDKAMRVLLGGKSAGEMLHAELAIDPSEGMDMKKAHISMNPMIVERCNWMVQDGEFDFVLKANADAVVGIKYVGEIITPIDIEKEAKMCEAGKWK